MIPELLHSSYQRYKEDTNVFTTWLSQAARACGFKLAGKKREKAQLPEPSTGLKPIAPRLKGKARKDAKAQATSSTNNQGGPSEEPKPVQVSKYEMTTRNLIEQAEAVGSSGKPNLHMPMDVLRVARRAINARKRCTNWFKETESKDEASTQGHAHFTAVLEQALDLLKPCYNKESLSSDYKPISQKRAQTFDDDLTNRFRMLQVEDKDNDMDITAPEITVQPKGTSKKTQSKALSEREVWELAEEFHIEIGFIIFCFFEDLHRIQDLLKKTWQEYKLGRLDLVTCTMTTNLAFDLVRRAEEDVIGQAPEMLKKPRSYEAISTLIFFVDSFTKGKSPTKEQEVEDSLRITPFDEFIYLSTARILMKFEQLSAAKIAYPQPVPPVRMSYISRPDLLELPQVKKWEEEDEFLSQLLMDMSLDDNLARAMLQLTEQRKAPAMDELSKGLYKLRKEGEVSTWIVFAARVLLDIRDIMGKDFSRGYREQVAAGCAAFKTLDMTVENGALTPKGERWKARDGQQVMDLWSMIQYWTIKNPFPMMKQKWLAEKNPGNQGFRPFSDLPPMIQEEVKAHYKAKGVETEVPPHLAKNLQEIGLRHIKHATDPNFLRMQNPLASGTMMFNILLDSTYSRSVFSCVLNRPIHVQHTFRSSLPQSLIQKLQR